MVHKPGAIFKLKFIIKSAVITVYTQQTTNLYEHCMENACMNSISSIISDDIKRSILNVLFIS